MNNNILVEGLPALEINNNNYLVYSPYKKMFAKVPRKILNDFSAITQLRKYGLFYFPEPFETDNRSIIVVLNITKKCNLFCKYCWADSSPFVNEEMTPNTAVKIIRNLTAPNKIERIHFMGGEPTLNFEAIQRVVTCLEDFGVDPMPVFYITTNGVMAEGIQQWLIDKRFAFSISWDGLQKAHDKQRAYVTGKGTEDKVRTSILRVAEKGLPLKVRMTISKFNLPYLYESVHWLADHGVKFVHIEAVTADGRGSEFTKAYAPNYQEFVDEFFRVVDLADEKGFWIMNSHLANLYTPKSYYCSSLKRQIYNFNPDGSISHCHKVQSYNDSLADRFVVGHYHSNKGNIKIDEAKSVMLASIDVSKYHDFGDYFLKNFYSGGCPYRNLKATGSWSKVDPMIYKMNKVMLKKAILHIYKQALKGKTSALEGYIHFYRELVPDKNEGYKANNMFSEVSRSLHPYCASHSIKFVPIPMASPNQLVEIDACDICI